MTDEIVLKLIKHLKEDPRFAKFSTILRSGKYLILRAPRDVSNDDQEVEFQNVFGPHSTTSLTRCVYYRQMQSLGDVRIHFEFVRMPEVHVIAQQV